MASSVISVIGGAGHVGLPFSLVSASSGHKVYAIDKDLHKINQLNAKKMPFLEEGGQELLERLDDTSISFTTEYGGLSFSDFIVVMIGAPLDEEGNPRIDSLFDFFLRHSWAIRDESIVVLRSTVPMGTTEVIKRKFPKLNIVFAPERVAQGKAIQETTKFPQLIGTKSDECYRKVEEFFLSLGVPECIRLTPEEAECAKLATNMYRYINFAFANQLYIQTLGRNIDLQKVITAANKDYPRMNMSLPGMSAGYCLSKDGMLLLTEGELGSELISISKTINESLPLMLSQLIPDDAKVLILGAAFKADSDDIRLSLSFKLKKALILRGIEYTIYDPLVMGFDRYNKELFHPTVVVVMTPHTEFNNFQIDNPGTLVIDIWKHLPQSKNSTNGIYHV